MNITDAGIAWRRDEEKIADEAARDGIYGLRTSSPAFTLTTTPRRSSAAFDLLGLSCHLGYV